jgi:hypothetical protein
MIELRIYHLDRSTTIKRINRSLSINHQCINKTRSQKISFHMHRGHLGIRYFYLREKNRSHKIQFTFQILSLTTRRKIKKVSININFWSINFTIRVPIGIIRIMLHFLSNLLNSIYSVMLLWQGVSSTRHWFFQRRVWS